MKPFLFKILSTKFYCGNKTASILCNTPFMYSWSLVPNGSGVNGEALMMMLAAGELLYTSFTVALATNGFGGLIVAFNFTPGCAVITVFNKVGNAVAVVGMLLVYARFPNI